MSDLLLRAGALALALLSTPAWGADVDLFEPAGSLVTGQGSLQVESTRLGPEGWSGSIAFGLNRAPVVRIDDAGQITPEVGSMVPIHLQGSYTAEGLMRVDVVVPAYAWVDAPLTGFSGAALGDVRIGAALPLIGDPDGRIHLGLVPRIGIPTGSSGALVANGIRTTLLAALGGRVSDVGLRRQRRCLPDGQRSPRGGGPGPGEHRGGQRRCVVARHRGAADRGRCRRQPGP